jgi:ABC-type transport system substrate-binding protein
MRRGAVGIALALLVSTVVAQEGLTAPVPVIRVDILTFPATLSAPVDRLEVRQAVSFALDRSAIAALMPGAAPAIGINHPKLRGYNAQVRGYPYDPARARALLSQANWSADSILKIYISTSRGYVGPDWDAVRAKILDNLAAVGVKTEYVRVPFNTVVQLIDSGTATVIIGWVSDPRDFGYPYFSVGIAHDWKYKDADALLAQWQQAADQTQKDRIAQELEQLLLDRALVIPLFFRG